MSCLLTWNEFVDTAASEPVRRYCGATSEDDRRQIAAETDLKLNLGDLLYIGRRKELKLAATLMALDSQLAEEHKHPVNGPRKLKKKADLRLTQLGKSFKKSFNPRIRGSPELTAQVRYVLTRPVLHILTAKELSTKTCCPDIKEAIAAQNASPDLPPAQGAAHLQMPAPPSTQAPATECVEPE